MNNLYFKSLLIFNIFFFLFFINKGKSQDIHFSQFYAAPMFLSPAMTGHIEGNYRLNLNYKRQWTGVSKSGVYNTPAISFDMNFRKKRESRHSFGVGIGLLNDLSGSSSKLSNLTVLLGGAAHINIDQYEKHFISLGLNAGLVNRRLKTQDMLFASQLNQGVLDGSIDSGENIEKTNLMNLDIRLGAIYSVYPSSKTNFKLGLAAFHAFKMDETVNEEEHTRPMNFIAHGEMNYDFNSKISLQPYFLWMSQSKAMEITAGANTNILFGEGKAFFAGAGYRVFDGAILVAGIEIYKYKFGLSYDIATTDLGKITNGRGDFEISFQILGMSKKSNKPVLPALRYF